MPVLSLLLHLFAALYTIYILCNIILLFLLFQIIHQAIYDLASRQTF